ncbi:MAG: hypothetical protein RL001_140 [Pseudomonadota bacterium]|jgi:hypothetical protein|nr:hypothetical protein [Oxalobacteraceae bacterium]
MLSKIFSRASRYPYSPRANGKFHQAQRSLSTQNTRLAQLNKDCLAELKKIEINESLWSTVCEIEDKFRADINDEVNYEYQRVPDHLLFSPDDSPAAAERALGYQLACGLSETPRFLLNYSVRTPEMTLEAAITPRHKGYLIESFTESFNKQNDSDQMAIAGAVQPEVLIKLGLPVSCDAMNLSIANKKAGKPQLNEDHLIALIDYCSSDSGMFNAINDSMRIWQLCGANKLALITSCLSRPLNEGLSILSKHDAFLYRGTLYKGLTICNAAGAFRLSRMQPGMQYCSPHWSSATHFEKQNYAAIKPDRQLQMTILNTIGVRAHMFNNTHSIGEGEVIMPPKPIHFLEESEVEPALQSANRRLPTIYGTMTPIQSEAEARPREPHAILV